MLYSRALCPLSLCLALWVAAGTAVAQAQAPADGDTAAASETESRLDSQATSPSEALPDSQWWLASGFWSHHTRRADRYQQDNTGVGIEWHGPGEWKDWQLNAGHYRNSRNKPSNYLQVGWMPLQLALPAGVLVKGGASVGVVNGYPRMHGGGYFATLVPALSAQWQRLGVNLVYIPSVGTVDGAFALQAKLRVL
jgi:hypothetical protein